MKILYMCVFKLTVQYIFVLTCLLLIQSTAAADAVYLKNGFVIKGDIVKETEDGVWVEEEPGNAVLWYHSEIKKIEESPSVKKEEAASAEGEDCPKEEAEERRRAKKEALLEKYKREVAHAKNLKKKQRAISRHKVLVGMNADEVTESVGRPYEEEGDIEKEGAWTYGYIERKRAPGRKQRILIGDKVVYEVYFVQTLKVHFREKEVVSVEDKQQKFQL